MQTFNSLGYCLGVKGTISAIDRLCLENDQQISSLQEDVEVYRIIVLEFCTWDMDRESHAFEAYTTLFYTKLEIKKNVYTYGKGWPVPNTDS